MINTKSQLFDISIFLAYSLNKQHDAAGKVISVLHSGGIHDQIYSWNDRASLEYR